MNADRRIALDRDAVHNPAVIGVIVERHVQEAPVVPDAERPRRPADTAGELRSRRMFEEVPDQRLALVLCHADEMRRGRHAVDIEGRLFRLRMDTDERMRRRLRSCLSIWNFLSHPFRARRLFVIKVKRSQSARHRLHAVR